MISSAPTADPGDSVSVIKTSQDTPKRVAKTTNGSRPNTTAIPAVDKTGDLHGTRNTVVAIIGKRPKTNTPVIVGKTSNSAQETPPPTASKTNSLSGAPSPSLPTKQYDTPLPSSSANSTSTDRYKTPAPPPPCETTSSPETSNIQESPSPDVVTVADHHRKTSISTAKTEDLQKHPSVGKKPRLEKAQQRRVPSGPRPYKPNPATKSNVCPDCVAPCGSPLRDCDCCTTTADQDISTWMLHHRKLLEHVTAEALLDAELEADLQHVIVIRTEYNPHTSNKAACMKIIEGQIASKAQIGILLVQSDQDPIPALDTLEREARAAQLYPGRVKAGMYVILIKTPQGKKGESIVKWGFTRFEKFERRVDGERIDPGNWINTFAIYAEDGLVYKGDEGSGEESGDDDDGWLGSSSCSVN